MVESSIWRRTIYHAGFMNRFMKKRTFAGTFAVLLLSSGLQAQEKCPVEVKILLPPPTVQTVIASLSFGKEAATRVYFFDTDSLDLLKQGVIVRVRQGAANDLTVKVRAPADNKQIDTALLREHFPCEIDRSGAGEETSYAIQRKYTPPQVPEKGADIVRQFSASQEKLLRDLKASIDWTRVQRIADIGSTKWATTAQPPLKLALELWEWPTGKILEVSTKTGPDGGESTYAEVQRLLKAKNLSLSAEQGTKTRIALETLTQSRSPAK
jgi:hypothetical protein